MSQAVSEQRATLMSAALESEADKLLACIHCGLCLEACPTYVHTGDENDGPRGRIYLMRAVEEKRLPLDSPAFARHIERCLGCRACEAACPAGVQYGQLLEAARDDLRTGRQQQQAKTPSSASPLDRVLRLVLRHVWPHPARLRAAFAAARLFRDSRLPALLLKLPLPRNLAFPLALLASSSPAGAVRVEAKSPANDAASADDQTGRALLFTGCVTEGLFARVNRATERVLRVNNCAAIAPDRQNCCGALHAHAGDLDGARALARRNIDAFADGAAPIVTNAGGCGAMLLSYEHLLHDDPQYAERARLFSARVRDVSQLLTETGVVKVERDETAARDGGGKLAATYDASCHLIYGQRAGAVPQTVIKAADNFDYRELSGSEVCCGGAGIYNLLQPELSARVLDEKLRHVRETGAQLLATGNPGCHMQIGAGARLAGMENFVVCHPIEMLDRAYADAGFYKDSSPAGE